MKLDAEDIEAIAASVADKLKAGQGSAVSESLTVQQAMAELGYTNRASFLRAVRAHRMPVTEINSRNFVFDAAALRAWKERKTLNAA